MSKHSMAYADGRDLGTDGTQDSSSPDAQTVSGSFAHSLHDLQTPAPASGNRPKVHFESHLGTLDYGLVSVTFRNFAPVDVVKHAVGARARHIEWSANNHVPTGAIDVAREVNAITRDAGLGIAGYGTYYRVGMPPTEAQPFEPCVETAIALGANNIRVWAGDRGSANVRDSYWNAVVNDARRVAEMAHAAGLTVSFEFQANTLNDTGKSSVRFMTAINHPGVRTYWQPDSRLLPDERLEGLRHILPWLKNIHVFHWTDGRRQNLMDGQQEWLQYLTAAAPGREPRVCLLEFVKDDLLSNFAQDVETLRSLASQANARVKRA